MFYLPEILRSVSSDFDMFWDEIWYYLPFQYNFPHLFPLKFRKTLEKTRKVHEEDIAFPVDSTYNSRSVAGGFFYL